MNNQSYFVKIAFFYDKNMIKLNWVETLTDKEWQLYQFAWGY